MKKLSLQEIRNMSKEDYMESLLNLNASEVDNEIQHQLMMDLVNKYVQISKDYEMKIHEIELMSITDPLTKAFNRLKFNQAGDVEIERFIRYNESFGVMMMDIDYFKKVNDNFGHDIGDETLIRLTEIVSSLLRKTDVFARWGGEEFIALVVQTDKVNLEKLAERVRKSVEDTEFNKIGHITISMGISIVNKADSLATIIKRCDEAMYMAKNSGRNRVVYQ